MAARKEVWDLEAPGGPLKLDMFAVDADEAVKNDPGRYSFSAPDGTVERDAAEKVKQEQIEKSRITAEADEKILAAERERIAAKRDLDQKDADRKKAEAQKKRENDEKNGLSKEQQERQIDEKARQKSERARQEAGVATGDVKVDAGGQTLRGIPPNGMTTESIQGPVSNRAEQGMDQQIPASPTPPDRQGAERVEPLPADQPTDKVPASDIKSVEVKK